MIQLGNHFSADDRNRHSEWLRQRAWFIKAKHDHQRREEIADKLEDGVLATATEAMIATQAQIDAFEARLDSYDIAITEALIENREQTDLIEARLAEIETCLQDMLQQAYLLEDGRRVFKSEDGRFVIDEFGENVTRDEVDFDLVTGPPAERYLEKLKLKRDDQKALEGLQEERRKLEEAQKLIQEKREILEQGNPTVQDLEDLDSEILDAMPPSARSKLPGFDNAENALDLKYDFTTPANPTITAKTIVPSIQPEPI